MKKLLLLLVMCLMIFGVCALPKNRYQASIIDDANGLPDKNISDFVFDKFGFLWVTTEGNIVRYAYKNSVIFNHRTNPKINSDNFRDLLLIDSTLWTFSAGDLYGIDIVSMDLKKKSLDRKYGNITSFVHCPDGLSLMISTDKGYLLKYNTQQRLLEQIYFFNKEILSFIFFNDYTIFLFLQGIPPIVRFDLNQKKPLSSLSDLYVNLWSHFEKLENQGYSFVAGKTVLKLNLNKDMYDSLYSFPFELRDIKAKNGILYYLTVKNQVFEKDLKTGISELIYDGGANEIKFLKFGLNGLLYLVSRNGLIILKKQQPFEALREYETIPVQKIRRGIVEDKAHQRLFFLTYNGVYVYNQKTKTYESYIAEIINAYNACIDSKYIYVVTDGAGVYSIRLSDLKVELIYSYKKKSENDVSVFKLNDESILLGWYKGLKILNLKTRKLQRLQLAYKGRLYDDILVSEIMCRNSNEWWIATSRGIFLLNKDFKVIRRYASDEPAGSTISTDEVNTIHFTKNGCLAGLADDLIFIPFDHGSIESFFYDKKIPVNKIIGILEDKLGRVWLSSYNGLFCMDMNTHAISAYHAPDYFQFDEFNKASLLLSASGKMYYGTVSEYFSFDPLEYETNKLNYTLNVNTISIIDKQNVKIRYHINKGELFELPSPNSNLIVTLLFQNQLKPDAVRYYYKIEGLSDNWVSLENLSTLQLFSLPTGIWNLYFKAVNIDDMSAAETYVKILVPSIYYKTIWFTGLMILLVILIGYAIHLNRVNNFKKLLLLRKEISNELHDSVGTAVTKSILVAETIQRESGSKDNRLQQIIDYSKQVNSSFRDVLWSLEQSNDQILNLFDRISEIGNAAVENTPFEFVIMHHDVADDYTLTIRQKRELLMVTREAIHNVLKHSTGNMIVFEFRKVDEKLNLHIHDNGINETQDIQFSGIGLESIKMRISKIGGKVSFKKGKDGFDIDINV